MQLTEDDFDITTLAINEYQALDPIYMAIFPDPDRCSSFFLSRSFQCDEDDVRVTYKDVAGKTSEIKLNPIYFDFVYSDSPNHLHITFPAWPLPEGDNASLSFQCVFGKNKDGTFVISAEDGADSGYQF